VELFEFFVIKSELLLIDESIALRALISVVVVSVINKVLDSSLQNDNVLLLIMSPNQH
jgi:hypothetical protein